MFAGQFHGVVKHPEAIRVVSSYCTNRPAFT